MLSSAQVGKLCNALKSYTYPKKTFDFTKGQEILHPDMRSLEAGINRQLTSSDPAIVKDGLSNVVYWGFMSQPVVCHRVKTFRDNIAKQPSKVLEAMSLFQSVGNADLKSIKKLKLPQFSNVSFISKLLMFLVPKVNVVLDRQLASLKGRSKLFTGLTCYQTSIPVTASNQQVYVQWCSWCQKVAATYFRGEEVIAVDVERAIFQLIRQERLDDAAELVNAFPG